MQGRKDDIGDHYYLPTKRIVNNEQNFVHDKIDISFNR